MNKPEYGNVTESIELSLPVNAAYVSTARLTASSIANRQGFDIDEMEDIKAAVSEACTYVIRKSHGGGSGLFRLVFDIGDGFVAISLSSDNANGTADDEEMSILMIKALMDDTVVKADGGRLSIQMRKTHQVMEL